jgi:hypothetical protein
MQLYAETPVGVALKDSHRRCEVRLVKVAGSVVDGRDEDAPMV